MAVEFPSPRSPSRWEGFLSPLTGRAIAAAVLVALATCGPAPAREAAPEADVVLDAGARQVIIEGVLARVRASYLYRKSAFAMDRAIRARARRGAYDGITSARQLAETLTAHLRTVSRDQHLSVQFSEEALPSSTWQRRSTRDRPDSLGIRARQRRFGFERIDRLPGNVGYLEIRSFDFEPALAEPAVVEVMTRLARSDALIIDVRRNGGGSPRLAALVSSYLFGPDPVRLSTLQWPRRGRTEPLYTRRAVGGARFGPAKPVYVLTGRRTFSAAEAFAYDLQALGRVVVVGDTTAGGAHVGGMYRVTDHIGVWVPGGRPINPLTRSNWERVGVRPDVPVPADSALAAARALALRTLLERASDPDRKHDLARALAEMEGP